MVTVFTVVGEHQVDTTRLLVLGADGHYYEYRPTRRGFRPVDLDRDWVVYEPPGEVGCSGAPKDEAALPITRTAHSRR